MTDSTAIGFAMIGCAYFTFIIGLGLIAIVAFTINLAIELIKEAINKRKETGNNDR